MATMNVSLPDPLREWVDTQVKGGEYTVILDPVLAGVFIHEAFGHLSEADHVHENPRMRELLELGKEFGPSILNVVASAAEPGLSGSYKYDSEGVRWRVT